MKKEIDMKKTEMKEKLDKIKQGKINASTILKELGSSNVTINNQMGSSHNIKKLKTEVASSSKNKNSIINLENKKSTPLLKNSSRNNNKATKENEISEKKAPLVKKARYNPQ